MLVTGWRALDVSTLKRADPLVSACVAGGGVLCRNEMIVSLPHCQVLCLPSGVFPSPAPLLVPKHLAVGCSKGREAGKKEEGWALCAE